jgi:hypothetical protein
MKTSAINWISEQEAMQMLGYAKSSLRIFTMNEKRKKLPIRAKKLNHKKVIYSKTDIEQFINQ